MNLIHETADVNNLSELANKYSIDEKYCDFPIILYSKIADELYKTNDLKYAICDSDKKIQLVSYNNEKELTGYCIINELWLCCIIDKDGSGRIIL